MARLTGTIRNDTLTGGDGSDQLFGLAGNDALTGGLGDDVLDGGLGADTMGGGQGNDRYFIDALGETIVEAVNEGRDLVTVRNTTLTKAIDNVEDYTFTGTARVNFRGSAGDNSITGAAASDTLFGFDGNDVLNGGAGADSLDGGDGNDIYFVDNAGDVVREAKEDISGGVDLVLSSVSFILGSGVDRLELVGTAAIDGKGNDLANNMRGNSAANRLSTLGGNDAFDGAGGNDTLDGGLGADTMFGGTGNDTYIVDDIGDVVIDELAGAKGGVDTVFSSTALATLGTNVENLTLIGNTDLAAGGNELSNRITGNDGRNQLNGGAGNDTIDGGGGDDDIGGGEGNDLLIGGTGDDTYRVDRNDRIVESVAGLSGGRDSVFFLGTGDFTLGANLEDLKMDRGGGSTATGNALDNSITASNSGNKLLGLLGADTLLGGARIDTLDGGKGADRMEGGQNDDRYIVDDVADVVIENTGEGVDEILTTLSVFVPVDNVENYTFLGPPVVFSGNELDNEISGTKGNDTLNGGGGSDNLRTGSGNDVLRGNDGDDTLDGGEGNDTLDGGAGNDVLGFDLGPGNDVILGGDGDDEVFDQAGGNDTLEGGAGNDGLQGGFGDDVLRGGDGNDGLVGGLGADRLEGGRGDDHIILEFRDRIDSSDGNDTVALLSVLDGHDLIRDFDGNPAGGQDVLNLDALFDELGISAANRASHVQVVDKGNLTIEIRIDTSVAGDGVFDYLAVTMLTIRDAITVGSDIIVV